MGGARYIEFYVGPYADVMVPPDQVRQFHEVNERFWGQRTDEGVLDCVDVRCVLGEAKSGDQEFTRFSVLPPGSPETMPKRQTSWSSYQGAGDSEEVVAITPEEVRAEIEWFEQEYAEYLRALADVCGPRVQVLWGVVPQADF